MARLGDVCTFFAGTGFPNQYQGHTSGEYPFFKVGDISRNVQIGQRTLEYCDNYINDEIVKIIRGTIIPQGTVVFAKIGEALRLNRRAITICKCLIDNNVMGLKPIDNVLTTEYFYYLMTALDLQKYCEATTVPSVRKSTLEKVEIAVPSIEEQNKIVNILNKLNDLIYLRKQQLAKLDELVKARFVEMFGDEKQFTYMPLSESVEEMFIGPFGSSLKNDCFVSKEDAFCMVYEQKHAIRKTMDVGTRYVCQKKYNELKRFTVMGGDIIVSCRGTIGEIYILPDDAPLGIMHPSIMKIRLKESVYNKNYFVFALEQSMKKHHDEANGSGVKMAVTATTLGKERFAIPPMPSQQQFANFVVRTNRQKLTIQQSLDKLEVLRKSLMQEYFG